VKPKGFGWRVGQERRLKAVREGRDFLKRDLARAIGASESPVGRWELQGVVPEEYVVIQLAEFFGVTPAWLRYGQEPREAPQPTPYKPGELSPKPAAKPAATPRGRAVK
jgi:transcriptional regulator with XRE-family HTH domain